MCIEMYDRRSSGTVLKAPFTEELSTFFKSKGDRIFSVEQLTRIGIV
jgi:hypothetical protein